MVGQEGCSPSSNVDGMSGVSVVFHHDYIAYCMKYCLLHKLLQCRLLGFFLS